MASNFYEILGVSKSANDADIKRAFKELAKKYHPDKHPGEIFYEEHFKKINEAYQTLSDPKSRKIYDLRLFYAQTNTTQSKPNPAQTPPPNQPKKQTNTSNKSGQTQQKKPGGSQSNGRSASDQKKLNKYYIFIGASIIILCVFGFWFYNFMNNYTSNMYYVEGLKEEVNHNDREAINNYLAALSYNSNNPEANEKAGDLYIKLLDNYESSLKFYRRAALHFKDTRDIRRVSFKKVQSLIKTQKYSEAKAEIRFIEKLPDITHDDSTLYYEGDIAFYQDHFGEARSYYSKYYAKHYKSYECPIKISLCHFNEGNVDYALHDLNKIIDLFPAKGEAFFYKGRILVYEKDTLAACRMFKKADSLNIPSAKEALYSYCQ